MLQFESVFALFPNKLQKFYSQNLIFSVRINDVVTFGYSILSTALGNSKSVNSSYFFTNFQFISGEAVSFSLCFKFSVLIERIYYFRCYPYYLKIVLYYHHQQVQIIKKVFIYHDNIQDTHMAVIRLNGIYDKGELNRPKWVSLKIFHIFIGFSIRLGNFSLFGISLKFNINQIHDLIDKQLTVKPRFFFKCNKPWIPGHSYP